MSDSESASGAVAAERHLQSAHRATEEVGVLDRAVAFGKAFRPHQWVKNLLLFVPILASGSVLDTDAWAAALIGFLAFSATASGIYMANDLADLEADRKHPRKRFRPFASGRLPTWVGLAGAPVLVVVGGFLALLAGILLIQVLYVATTLAYTLVLKRRLLVDVFVLSILYTLRLFAGGQASGYHVSAWLLAFAVFLFLSLALVKRVGEILGSSPQALWANRRGYRAEDVEALIVMGIASSFAASLVLALYIQSDTVAETFRAPELLWLTVPLVLYWLCRTWVVTRRGGMHDDPILYAVRDRVSWGVLAAFVTVHIVAKQVDVAGWLL